MTENAIIQISAGVISLLGTIFSGIIAYFMVRLKVQAEHAKAATVEVAKALEDTQGRTDKGIANLITIASATHMLVNSASLVQLRLNSLMAKRIADLTGEPGDTQAAVLAENLYERHKAQQLAAGAISVSESDIDVAQRLASVNAIDAAAAAAVTVTAAGSNSSRECTMKDCKFRGGSPSPECTVIDCPFRD
jgi:hypothetical protein